MNMRRYREAKPPEQIARIIRNEKGKQFDPELADYFLESAEEMYAKVYYRGLGDTAMHAVEGLIEPMGSNSEGTELFSSLRTP